MKELFYSLFRMFVAAALLAVSAFAFGDNETKFGLWTAGTHTDEISEKFKSAFAVSDSAFPTRKLEFPYDNTQALLLVICDRKGVSGAGVTFNDDIISYDDVLRAKWDNTQKTHDISMSNGSANFSDAESVISLMKTSSKVIIGIDLFEQGEVFFKWNLDGSSAAIKEAHRRCKI